MTADRDTRVEQFLDDATAGLRDDPELRRDVRAELAAHLDDKRETLREEGVSEDRLVEEALKAMGDVLEAASSLSDANRRRMTVRGRVRLLLRFALVPGAVVAAVLTWAGMTGLVVGDILPIRRFVEAGGSPEDYWLSKTLWFRSRLSAEQQLILKGDPTREGKAQQQRAIWERHPTNLVYLANYISSLVSQSQTGPEVDTAVLVDELDEAARLEPDNARYDLLRAALLAQASCAYERGATSGSDRAGDEPRAPPKLDIRDREQFDAAMALFRRGVEKPSFQRYVQDMVQERRAIMGPQTRYIDVVRQTAMTATVVLPDLQHLLTLSRIGVAYGEMLLLEGRERESAIHLGLREPLALHLARDSFALIDILVVYALLKGLGEDAARIHERAGLPEAASRIRARSASLCEGYDAWHERRRERGAEWEAGAAISRERGGILASTLVPSLGTWPEKADRYDANRRVEYTLVTEAVVGVMILGFLLAMIACCAVALRWRFVGTRGAAIPILLIPRSGQLLMVIGAGVLAPFALFLVVTRCLGWSGHNYSFLYGGHKVIAELALLVTAIGAVPAAMIARAVTARCRALELAVTPLVSRHIRWGLYSGAVALLLLWLVPPGDGETLSVVAAVIAGLVGLCLATGGLGATIQGLVGKRENGLYYGTLFRSLIPAFSLVIVVLCLSSGPLLVRSETAYLADDELMTDERGGFTRVETDLTYRLRDDLLERFEALDAR